MSFSPLDTGKQRAISSDGSRDLHEFQRADLKPALTNAIDHARISQRLVAVLMVKLIRADKLDAIVGIPTIDVMRRAMKRLPDILRGADRLVQITDDKVCIMLPNLKSETQAWLAASKIQQTLEAPFSFNESLVSVRPVVGIACFPVHAATADELIIRADIAMQVARIRDVAKYVFQPEDKRFEEVYSGFEDDLREALRTNQLELHYQPQVDFKTGKCSSVEALLRWQIPERGFISPAAIIQVAEASGLIGTLTSWVLNTSLRQQNDLRRNGADLNMSVNISTVNLADTELPDMVGQAIGTWQADPQKIMIEITESSTINDIDYSLTILQRLKEIGMKLSLDDFGTGYSSLSYVKRFPLDEIKIDKLFVQNMCETKKDQQIVRSVIDLAHHFELSVVAEGVEDDATYRDLKKFGCDVAQGFLISKALPYDALLSWIKKGR